MSPDRPLPWYERFNWVDLLLLGIALAIYVLLPGYLSLGAKVLIMILFTLSLDLAIGYAGIETLGHAAFYGVGAYAAAFFALYVSSEPLSGLLVAALVAGAVGALSGAIILRARGLTLLMLTFAFASLLHEIAQSAKHITGGDDGLSGYAIAPLLGLFPFDIYGKTAYLYCLGVAAISFVLCKILVASQFGLTVRGIKSNAIRMRLLGVPVLRRLISMYTISAMFAGIAGGLSAHIVGVVSVDALGIALSTNVLFMLMLGGPGRLYGAILGGTLFEVFSDRAAVVSPAHWYLGLGLMLIVIARYMPDGLIGPLVGLTRRRTAKPELPQ